MANRKRKIGERWINAKGLRVREGKRGRTYQIKVTSPKGSKWKTFKTEHEAVVARDKERNAVHEGTFVLNSKTKLCDFLDNWLKTLQGKKESTLERYDVHARHIKNGIGEWQLQKLEPQIIESFIANLHSLDRGTRHKIKPMSNHSKVLILSTLKTALDKAVFYQLIPNNPCNNVASPKDTYKYIGKRPLNDSETFTKKHVLSPANLDEILTLFKPHYSTWLPTFTLWQTGLRRGELCAISWADCDFENNRIWIGGTVDDKHNVSDPKTSLSEAWVDVTPELMDFLSEHKVLQAEDALLLSGRDSSSHWFVFAEPASPDVPLRPGTIASRISYHLRKTRFSKVTPHDIRHAHGSALLDAGWSIPAVAARLRETQETLLKTYAHALKDRYTTDALASALVVKNGKNDSGKVVNFRR